MQRQNPLPREGTSLSPMEEGTLIHPREDIPSHSMTKSLNPEEEAPISPLEKPSKPKGLPEFYIASSSNALHQNSNTMVDKACHIIPTPLHGNQPQISFSATNSPGPSPMVIPSFQLYSSAIHKAIVHKEISNKTITKVSTEILPTLYNIKSMVASLDIVVAPNGMINQRKISFLPRLSDVMTNYYHLQKLLCWKYNGLDNIMLIQTTKYLKQLENPSIVLLFGIRSGGDDAVQAIKEIGFSSSYRIDPVLLDDGVWLLWNKEDVTIEVCRYTSNNIYAIVHFTP